MGAQEKQGSKTYVDQLQVTVDKLHVEPSLVKEGCGIQYNLLYSC